VLTHILLENVGGSEQNRSVIANVQSDDLWLSHMHAATHILQEKTHACGVLKRYNFQVHVSLGSAETLVRRGGIINHYSIAYSLSNISAKNYQNRLMWVESIVCNISVVFFETQCIVTILSSIKVWAPFAMQILTESSDPQIFPSLGELGPLSNTILLGSTGVSLPNGISFRPIALAGYMSVTDDIQTDRQTMLQ